MSAIMEKVNVTLGCIIHFLVRYFHQRKEVNNYIVQSFDGSFNVILYSTFKYIYFYLYTCIIYAHI